MLAMSFPQESHRQPLNLCNLERLLPLISVIRIRTSSPTGTRVVYEATLAGRLISPGLCIDREHRLPETRV